MTRGDDTCVIFFLKDCSEGIKKPFSVLGKVLRKDTSSRNGSGIHVFTDESSSELDVRLRETNFGLILYVFDCTYFPIPVQTPRCENMSGVRPTGSSERYFGS